ncbi:concanavalin A-like lectin/glucanase domain-containing protein [Rhodocollybia butyracea]|uniref:Concanavalin A-like lectin/glucanase domain-containing protein n=1 Tax=Rhodocollybia butyracea TaxID=206335 RepID=A0A9P5UC01_9AGAR|nr:concanavalin A-like lectin/glucanase domain-containing protein [Rhodocollybia butyracea]
MSPLVDSDDDSNISPPPREPTVISVASPDPILKLPTRWSYEYRHPSLNLSENGRELTFQGANCNGDRDAAAARSVQPIPPACGVYYFEVEIHSKGQKAFSGPGVRLSRLPGWEETSWGYHGDDGCSFAAERTGTNYGPTFGLGDVVGCGIDFSTGRAFFTKNGTYLGPVFENVGKDVELYPTVGLQHMGESVKVNFGHETFRFDIDYHVQQRRQATWTTIMSRSLDPAIFRALQIHDGTEEEAVPLLSEVSEEQSKQTINKLVLSYLAHHGYVKTARAFQQQTRGTVDQGLSSTDDDIEMDDVPAPLPSTSTLEADIQHRTSIVNSVLSGNIDSALTQTRDHYPGALEAEEGLMLVKLRCRKFVELVLETAELEKKMKAAIAKEEASTPDGLEEDSMGMIVDDDTTFSGSPIGTSNGAADSTGPLSRTSIHSRPSLPAKNQYEASLNEALSFGKTLDKDYKATHNSEAKNIFFRTFAILTSSDPLSAGERLQKSPAMKQRSRSQGRPTHPALEMMYRQTSVCLLQLGLARVGAAAFANMQKEFLDN